MNKILQINTVYGVGSTGRIAKDIAILSRKNGYENYIAYGYGKSSEDYTIKIGSKIEYYIHNLLSRIFCMQGRFSYFATKRFLNKIDKIKPDIIHLHNIHGNYINYGLLFNYIKKNDIPVIWTFHDCWPFTGKCTHFDSINCNKWEQQCYKCKELYSYPSSFIIDNSRKEFIRKKTCFTSIKDLTIVTPSNWLMNKVKKSFLKDYHTRVINNGIDLGKFKNVKDDQIRNKYCLNNRIILLGVASDWSEKKGLGTFNRLAEELDERFVIVLIGLTPKQFKIVNNKIVKISRTNSIEELVLWYSTADIFINPTIEENFPTTNIEALACGTPVITYNTGGSPEIINEECGIVVEKNNYNQLKNEIINYKLKKCEKACIERSKLFNKENKFMEYMDLYKTIIDKRGIEK